MNNVELFLASSIVEFEHTRDKLAARIRGMNNALNKNGINLTLHLCEDYTHTWAQGEKQEKLNELIRNCHFFFALIGKDVGEGTREEIDVAFRQFRESGSLQQPRIIVFFQDLPNEEKTAAVFQLQGEVRQAGQYDVPFSNVDTVLSVIQAELFTSDAILNPESLRANPKSHLGTRMKIGKIGANRRKIEKLSKGAMTDDTEAELLVLYRENMVLTEAERAEWGTLYEYAEFLHKRGRHKQALEVGARLDEHYKSDTSGDRAASKGLFGIPRKEPEDNRAALKRLLGDCQAALGEHEFAEEYYRAALELYHELSERKGKYRADAAEMCVKVAEILFKTFRHEAAERLYREALEIYLSDAERYAREIGLLCHSMQALLGPRRGAEAGIFHRAEQTAVHCAVQKIHGQMGAVRENLRHWLEAFPCPDTITQPMKAAEAQALVATKDKPEDYERTLAQICLEKADWLFNHNQMESAEAFARKSLEIGLKLAKKNPDTFENSVVISYGTLAMILADTNRPRESEHYFRKALEICRQLAQKGPTTFRAYPKIS